jgi:phthiodiolone/phenolphthiodiolone dimycocerosates ketoreductase
VDIELGVPGQIMPPVDKAVQLAQKNEADGFDAVWWPDHLMGWHPDEIWTEDISPIAKYQPNPHQYFDPLMMMGHVGAHLDAARVGVVVTDLIRTHPAVMAQRMLTVDHLTRGKGILGLGSGERLNITPYGMKFEKPVGLLEEGIQVMKKLWHAEGKIDFEGKHFHPYGDKDPEIWTAAHGPRMLGITGRHADGWLPTKDTPEHYGQMLETIRQAGTEAGRDMDAFTPGMLGYVLVGPDEETVEQMTHHPLVRMLCIMLPSEVYHRLGYPGPFEGYGSGFHDFIPSAADRAECERIVEAIPPPVVRHYAFTGTVEQVAEEITAYYDAGLRHLVMWNVTAFGDPSLAGWSFGAMKQLKAMLKGA